MPNGAGASAPVLQVRATRRHAADLLGYLERNEAALVHYAARRRRGEPIATLFVESAVAKAAMFAILIANIAA